MQKKQLFTFVIVLLILCINNSFSQNNKHDFDENEAIKTIKNFYTEVLTLYIENEPALNTNTNKPLIQGNQLYLEEQKIRQKYCTKRLLEYIKMLTFQRKLDWDPFLEAQDYYPDWLKNLLVKKESDGENLFSVTLKHRYGSRTIKLTVTKEGEFYKIESLPNLLQAIPGQEDREVISFLTKFYTEHLLDCLKKEAFMHWEQKILQHYCTKRFLDYLYNNKNIFWDPFLETYEYPSDWVKTWIDKMIIQTEMFGNNIYSFFRWNPFENRYDGVIKIKVVRENGSLKIDGLPNLLHQIQ